MLWISPIMLSSLFFCATLPYGEIGQNSGFIDAKMPCTCWWSSHCTDGPFASSAWCLQSILWKESVRIPCWCIPHDVHCLVFKFLPFFDKKLQGFTPKKWPHQIELCRIGRRLFLVMFSKVPIRIFFWWNGGMVEHGIHVLPFHFELQFYRNFLGGMVEQGKTSCSTIPLWTSVLSEFSWWNGGTRKNIIMTSVINKI